MQDNTHDRPIPEPSLLAALRLARSDNFGPRQFHTLLGQYGTSEAALKALPDLIGQRGFKRSIRISSQTDAQREFAAAATIGAQLISIEDERYPEALLPLEDAPPVLTLLGNISLLQSPTLAIVGARNASALGMKFAESLAHDLGTNGQTIVSGLARGIDTAAHRGSIETGTIAAIAGGVDQIYPPENRQLYAAIAEKGLLVTEMPFGMPPRAQHFPRRNRIISALSRATIVVEAAKRSGSLITARFALEQGRDVMAVPGSPLDPRCEGTNALISQGATLVTNAEDVMDALEFIDGRTKLSPFRSDALSSAGRKEESRPPFEPEQFQPDPRNVGGDVTQQILERLGPTPIEIDELIRRLPFAPNIVLSTLMELEIDGKVIRQDGQMVSKAS